MIKIFGMLVILALLGCSQGPSATLDAKLISALQSDSLVDAYKACIFLGEIALNENQIEKIETSLPESTCKFYLLAKRVGGTQNIKDFVDHFPNAKKQKDIWDTHSNIGYPIQLTPPYIGFLATIATTNDSALDKLVTALNYTDGAHAEALIEILAKLYIKHSSRVTILLAHNKTSESLINLIIETSILFKGMKNE
jgi:hypothetical protein